MGYRVERQDSGAEISGETGGRRLLLVANAGTFRSLLKRLFRKEGYHVIEAGGPCDGICDWLAGEPEIVVIDLEGNGEAGLEVCRRLRKEESALELPVILLSAGREEGGLGRGFAAGASDFITKPLKPREALERVAAHLKFRDLALSQRHLRESLRSANRAKSKILGMVSHDLHGPALEFRAALQVLASRECGPLNETQCGVLERMMQTADEMAGLVNQLLCYAEHEYRKPIIDFRRDDLTITVGEAVNAVRSIAEEAGVLIKPGEWSTPVLAVFDREAVQRVVERVLLHAVQRSRRGGSIQLSLESGRESIWVIIGDGGRPIPDDGLKQYLHPYVLGSGVSPGDDLVRVDLAYARQIMRGHGGELEVRNAKGGKGVEVVLELKKRLREGRVNLLRLAS